MVMKTQINKYKDENHNILHLGKNKDHKQNVKNQKDISHQQRWKLIDNRATFSEF